MIKAELVLNKGFKWYSNKNISVKGFLFDSDNHYFEKEKLLDIFENINTKDELLKCVENANGLFTVLIKLSENDFLLANDIIRAFPVFYSKGDNDIYVSDDIHLILKELKLKELNSVSKNEFLSAGFVSGHNTLINNVQVTQSGELLSFENNILTIESYFNYYISKPNQSTKEELETKSKQIIDRTFNRLVKSLNGKMAVIPLSGGLDSRLIACKLKELGHEKILCYTFGKSTNNPEKITSEKVAKKLGLNWVFIEYNHKNIGKYINTEEFIQYYNFYSQYSSSFMFQDYFAVKYLTENKLIPRDSIFIPGYSGDFLGGSQLYKNGIIKFKASLKKIAKSIVNERYIHTKLSLEQKREIEEKIKIQLETTSENNTKLQAYSIFENWEMKENLSKFIGNVAHIYNYFDYEYRLPYWDYELVNFFKYIPYECKFGKILYNNVLKSYFKQNDVEFEEGFNLTPKEFRNYKLRKRLKKFIPKSIRKKISSQIDYLNYELILSDIYNELRKDPAFRETKLLSRNSYIAHWYLKRIE